MGFYNRTRLTLMQATMQRNGMRLKHTTKPMEIFDVSLWKHSTQLAVLVGGKTDKLSKCVCEKGWKRSCWAAVGIRFLWKWESPRTELEQGKSITTVHKLRLTRVKKQLNGALKDDAIIETLRPTHHAIEAGREFNNTGDGSSGIDEPKFASGSQGIMGFDIYVGVEYRGEGGGGIYDVEPH
ncbi:hypothetical protein O988_04292, partial [Pseudogymnoascus sp. VKM F-3808]